MIGRIFLAAGYLLGTLSLYAQGGEFPRYDNDLMYPPETMEQLSGMVDSLNTKFAACSAFRAYHGVDQATALRVTVIGQAAVNVEEAFSETWSPADMERFGKLDTVLVVRQREKGYWNKSVIEFSAVVLKDGEKTSLEIPDRKSFRSAETAGKWVREFRPKTEYSKSRFTAFYFLDDFRRPELPRAYGEMVAYVDCMIDTTVNKLLPESEKSPLVDLTPNYRNLSRRQQSVLLNRMRQSRVVGLCSQDDRPRVHARNISLLAAETGAWEVFLRAHLDIMNDRFDRMTDGSYAYGSRETYLKELEELGLDIPDLLVGVALRMDDASPNHYYGSTSRLGRAVTDSAREEEIFQRLLSMMGDDSLDTYNRLIAYFFAGNYCYQLPEGAAREQQLDRWNEAVKTLPTYFHAQHRAD